MADVEVTPAFVSTKPSSPDSTKIDGPRWNAPRLFAGGADGEVVLRDSTAGTGARWAPFLSPIPVTSYDQIPNGEVRFFFGGSPARFEAVYNNNGAYHAFGITP